jgi:hypothetical protein
MTRSPALLMGAGLIPADDVEAKLNTSAAPRMIDLIFMRELPSILNRVWMRPRFASLCAKR